MGGFVVWFGAWRVNGSLAVSRSIGKSVYVAVNSWDSILLLVGKLFITIM